MYGNAMQELDGGVWAEINPSQCPCRGGWLLSDFDTWHQCPLHGKGVPHPEEEGVAFDFEKHNLDLNRKAYRAFQERSGMTRAAFRRAVLSLAVGENPSPGGWVDHAETVSREAFTEALEARARSLGYACRLEAAWAADAALEAGARSRGQEPEVYATRGSPERADLDSWYF